MDGYHDSLEMGQTMDSLYIGETLAGSDTRTRMRLTLACNGVIRLVLLTLNFLPLLGCSHGLKIAAAFYTIPYHTDISFILFPGLKFL